MIQRTYITTGERIRNYLIVAFTLSLLVNAAGTLVYPDIRQHQDDTRPDVFRIDRRPTIVRTPPPPTPTPPAKPQSRPQVRPQHAKPFTANVPHTAAVAHGPTVPAYAPPKDGTTNPNQIGTGTALPAETQVPATSAPACANPNRDASVSNEVLPDYPDSARDMNLGPVTVLVEVTLDANGTLIGTKIAQSSDNAAIDQAALRAAHESTYAPRLVDCVPAGGEYLFRADFNQ
jgi:periplasmic protein TonB